MWYDLRDTDTVEMQGTRTSVAVAKRLGWITTDRQGNTYNQTPEAMREVDGTAAQERAVAAEAAQRAQDAETADMNRHPEEIEAAAQLFTGKVSPSDQIAMLVQMNTKGQPMPATLQRVAEQMGLSPEQAVDSLNAMAAGTQAQLRILAKSRGVDADAFADWARERRSDRVQTALQQHVLRRDVVGAWSGLITEYKATRG
jgi:hypothetical protein